MPKTTTVFIPGKAYEIVMKADFVTVLGKRLKVLPAEQMAARVALKNGERRNKGRGYRVLVTLTNDAAIHLCQWFSEFLASDDYRTLGTADALAVRTISDRLCEVAKLSEVQKEKQVEVNLKRVAAMQAGRARRTAERAKGAIERVAAYREWVKDDARYFATLQQKRNGWDDVVVPEKPVMPTMPSDEDYAAARENAKVAA